MPRVCQSCGVRCNSKVRLLSIDVKYRVRKCREQWSVLSCHGLCGLFCRGGRRGHRGGRGTSVGGGDRGVFRLAEERRLSLGTKGSEVTSSQFRVWIHQMMSSEAVCLFVIFSNIYQGFDIYTVDCIFQHAFSALTLFGPKYTNNTSISLKELPKGVQ